MLLRKAVHNERPNTLLDVFDPYVQRLSIAIHDHELSGDPTYDPSMDHNCIYPYEDPLGPSIIIGPGCFASSDREVLNWEGENYYRRDFGDDMTTGDQGERYDVGA